MRVLALCTYPIEAAATRYRISQYVGPLSKQGINIDVRPFLTSKQFSEIYKDGSFIKKAAGMLVSVLKRIKLTAEIGKYDLIFVQREAMLFGPAIFEWLYSKVGNIPMILDLDDATYLSYVSPVYGKFLSRLKFFGKTEKLIERSEVVVCGNDTIADFVESKGTKAVIMPTIVDLDLFKPGARRNKVPVVGWIGTHSTFPFLEKLFPVFQQLARDHEFILKIVGAGKREIAVDGLHTDNLDWSLEREVADFQSFDIGLYPLFVTDGVSQEWLMGKSGFKAIQYLAVGVPFVMSPVGICNEIGIAGETHFNAHDLGEWKNSLSELLKDSKKREQMGQNARQYSLQYYGLEHHAELLATIFREVLADR